MIWLWSARAVWALLPLAVGAVLEDALDGWSRGPATVAAATCWAAWTVALVALLAPRPWGLTALRVAAPAAVGITLAAAPSTDGTSAVLAVTSAVVAAVLALSAPVTEAAGNALAYGDEVRFALRVPTPLLFGPVPLAIALVAAGVAAGPLLLASQRWISGGVATALGIPAAVLAAHRLHALSRRWVVLVPAGLVVVDPLTLADPTLVRREQIASLHAAGSPPPAGGLDLRLGTTTGSVVLVARDPIAFGRRSGRATAALEPVTAVVLAPLRPAGLLAAAAARRIPTHSPGFGDSR